MEPKNIFVYIEVRNDKVGDVSYQLLSLAQDLKKQYHDIHVDQEVVAILCGHHVGKFVEACYRYGADQVILIDHEKLKYPTTQHTTNAIVHSVKQYTPEVLLIGATTVGRDIAPRVAANIRTGLTADAIKVEVDVSRSLLMTRPAFGGNLYATIICPTTYPQMSSIREGVFVKKEFNCPIRETIKLTPTLEDHDDVEVLERIERKTKDIDLTKANVIVAGGRSMVKHMDVLKETAERLKGTLGASRALVETGVITKDHQVGQTGTTVRPSIYIACGISGAVQHTAGMDQSQTIIAINTDPNAPIFGVSTLGVVADGPSVLKKLADYLR